MIDATIMANVKMESAIACLAGTANSVASLGVQIIVLDVDNARTRAAQGQVLCGNVFANKATVEKTVASLQSFNVVTMTTTTKVGDEEVITYRLC